MSYCALADLKTYLGITSTADDTLLTDTITRAEALIDSYCHRTFEVGSATIYADAYNDIDKDRRTLFVNGDVASLSAVVNNGTEVDSGDYYILPNTPPRYMVKLTVASGLTWDYDNDPEQAISLTGVFAYDTTVPAAVEAAAIRLSAYLYRQRDTSAGDIDRPLVAGPGVTLLPGQMPADVKQLLAQFVRVV